MVTSDGRNADADADPVRRKRARIARLTSLGKRAGYGLFLVAMVAFGAGAVTDFPGPLVTAVIASLILGSIILAPAIIFGYGVRAAEREERTRPR
jgi:preprotein translocase subunit SecF